MRGVFDKTKSENRSLTTELEESREYGHKLELQVSRMDDSCKLLADMQNAKSEIKKLCHDLEQKRLEMSIADEKISAQQKEIETLNRSLDACVFYQVRPLYELLPGKGNRFVIVLQGSRKSSVDGGPAVSSEKMRTIYYELGRRQADIRAISLSLSQVGGSGVSLVEVEV